jgi:hypothetical protein
MKDAFDMTVKKLKNEKKAFEDDMKRGNEGRF